VIVTGEAGDEQSDDLVADELVDDAVPGVDRLGRYSVEARQEG